MIPEILTAVIGAIVGGVFTLLVTLIVERHKERRTDRIEADREKKEIFQTRPEIAVTECKDYLARVGYGIKQKCDIELFVAQIERVTTTGEKRHDVVYAHYSEGDFNPDEWCCVIYKFENRGKTDISSLDIICNYKKDTCIFPCDSAQRRAAANVLSYWYCYDKKIRIGETISVKLCYHKDRILLGMFSAIMSVAMEDDNGRYWVQPLFAPTNKIYSSRQISYKEYREEICADIAEECFKKPWLW